MIKNAYDPSLNEFQSVSLRKNPHSVNQGFYVLVGETKIGEVSGNKLEGWYAISHLSTLKGLRTVSGFKDRNWATQYLLQVGGYTRLASEEGDS